MSKPLPELESGLVKIESVSDGPAKRRSFPEAIVEAEQLGDGAVALSRKSQPKTVFGAEASKLAWLHFSNFPKSLKPAITEDGCLFLA